ncbi:unnamed protein product [Moneuplotes crassus]|uniref:Uncharacterized protein n=1 Tax=Euplotes crassus TaxID=5936 RepID=A0AAD1XSX9_EUPCR|nr:unnamed protein product [Moneuplotes crassus]
MSLYYYSDDLGSFCSAEWNYNEIDEKIRDDYISGFKEDHTSDYHEQRIYLNRISNPSVLVPRIKFPASKCSQSKKKMTRNQDKLLRICCKYVRQDSPELHQPWVRRGPKPLSKQVPAKKLRMPTNEVPKISQKISMISHKPSKFYSSTPSSFQNSSIAKFPEEPMTLNTTLSYHKVHLYSPEKY